MVERSEIGRSNVSQCVLSPFLCIGQTVAIIFKLGKMPSLRDMYIIQTNGCTNSSLNSINKLPCIQLGPQTLEDFI